MGGHCREVDHADGACHTARGVEVSAVVVAPSADVVAAVAAVAAEVHQREHGWPDDPCEPPKELVADPDIHLYVAAADHNHLQVGCPAVSGLSTVPGQAARASVD